MIYFVTNQAGSEATGIIVSFAATTPNSSRAFNGSDNSEWYCHVDHSEQFCSETLGPQSDSRGRQPLVAVVEFSLIKLHPNNAGHG